MEVTQWKQSQEIVCAPEPTSGGGGSVNSLLFSSHFELGFLSLATKGLLTNTEAEREREKTKNQMQRENSNQKPHGPQEIEFLTIFHAPVPVPLRLGLPHSSKESHIFT